jgi:hypothetical protein
MEKARRHQQVCNPVCSCTASDRNTLAAYHIHLAAFFGIAVPERLERCVGKHPEKLWVKIPNYFCLSAYLGIIAEADIKSAHPKYLSYDVEPGHTTDEKLPGQENTHADGLMET